MLVVGQKEQDAGTVAVRVHGKGNVGVKPRAEVIADLIVAIRERRG
jgi:threonyl-tRNA synthetase